MSREQAVSALERAFVAVLNEVEQPDAVQRVWAEEIERRARRVMAGESAGEPWEDVRNRIERRLRKGD